MNNGFQPRNSGRRKSDKWKTAAAWGGTGLGAGVLPLLLYIASALGGIDAMVEILVNRQAPCVCECEVINDG